MRVRPTVAVEKKLQCVGNSRAVTRILAHPTLPLLATLGEGGELLVWEVSFRCSFRVLFPPNLPIFKKLEVGPLISLQQYPPR